MSDEDDFESEPGTSGSRRIFMPPPREPRKAALYRDLLRKAGLDSAADKLVLKHVELSTGESLLHAGCGSGMLAVRLKAKFPEAEVEGVDPGAEALEAAAELAEELKQHVLFNKGYLQDLPSTAERHDVVVCSLFLHRLRGREDRLEAFDEFRRVLRPGGRLLLVELGGVPRGLRGWLVRKLAEYERGLDDLLKTGLEEACRAGGFPDPKRIGEGPLRPGGGVVREVARRD
ncbi:MAG: class I SAM-dependent methyltransferase [Planctomycetota bacterium]|nr:class I SAM-dependent methyltransferase [Planctomycetota bacterium]